MKEFYTVAFDGFWMDGESAEKMPTIGGVYVVYEGIFNEDNKTSSLEKTLYISSCDNARATINDEANLEQWMDAKEDGHDLFFALAELPSPEKERVAAALVFEQKPPLNSDEEVSKFPFEDTRISLKGKTGLLNTEWEVVMDFGDPDVEDSNIDDSMDDTDLTTQFTPLSEEEKKKQDKLKADTGGCGGKC